jgi:type I restriction enzyme S subunit
MRSKQWSLRKVRDFAARSKFVNIEGAQLPPLSITKGRGVMLQSERYKKQIATDLRKYVIVRCQQFAFDPMSLYYGAIGWVDTIEIGLVSPDYVVFDVDDTVDKGFMSYLLRSPDQIAMYERVAETGNQFGKRRRVYWSVFEELEMRIPPLAEQRKIAGILSAVDASIARAQAVIERLQVVKAAMMVEFLTRGLPGQHSRFRKTEIGEMPEGWTVAPLDSCIDPHRPISYGILMPGKGWPGGIPVVKVKDIKNGVIDERDILLTSPELDHQYRRSRLRVGDLLLTIRGTTGRLARVPSSLDGANITQDTARLSIRAGINSEFVFFALQSPCLQAQIRDRTRGQAVKGINIGDVRKLQVPMPSIDEQEVFVTLLSAADECCAVSRLEFDALHRVRSGLLSVLLKGEVRVTSDEEVA